MECSRVKKILQNPLKTVYAQQGKAEEQESYPACRSSPQGERSKNNSGQYKGVVKPTSKNEFKDVIDELIVRGAQGIILGCTEIPMPIGGEDSSVPLFDTTKDRKL
jgi:hypothetical protein